MVDCFGAGGIATGVLELIRATRGLIEHSIISLVDDLRLLAQLPSPPPAYVIKPGRTRLIGFSGRLAWLVCRKGIDILHCNNHFAWLDSSLAARLTGCLCLQTFHGVEKPLAEMPRDIRVKCRLAAWLGNAVTAVSDASQHMVCTLGGLPEQAVEVIPNGVDLGRFRPCPPDAPERRALREGLGVAPETPLVVHVAGLRPIKDQATLLRAWGDVVESWRRESLPAPLLLIAGEGSCRRELEALAGELRITDRVRFLGQRCDLDALLPPCDVFVLSSLSEGMSFAILEAMAAGLPVVATRVGGNSELVEGGVSGLLVPARDPGALAGALRRLLRDPAERQGMASRARRITEERYDQSRSARRYLEVYRRLASRSSGRRCIPAGA
ncbi:MAG TPA: glycosyltransferase [Gemmataceae bacterium]|nr:glycosyltransferase [Gemmataceae bacterium]